MLTFKLADMKKVVRENKRNIGGRYMIDIPKNRKWVVRTSTWKSVVGE